MTPEAQRNAIAEHLGFVQRTEGLWWSADDSRAYIMPGSALHDVRKKMRLPCDNGVLLPDWLGDLNASHELEKTLGVERTEQYFQHLLRICNPAFCASAAQRAEAFLRTTGRWQSVLAD